MLTLLQEKKPSLNPFQRKLANLILSSNTGAVPYIYGKPGVGKSAVVRDIANKLGMAFFDIRLSQKESPDLGGFPLTEERYDPRTDITYRVLDYAIPSWADAANRASNGAIIFYDELNRATPDVMNAVLQILHDKVIGEKFKFNNSVYMVAAGNMGTEDGTNVNEMDSALQNRLVPMEFKVTIEDWCKYFAKDNLHWLLLDFFLSVSDGKSIEAGAAKCVEPPTVSLKDMVQENGGGDLRATQYPSRRAWTNFSKYLEANTPSHMTGIEHKQELIRLIGNNDNITKAASEILEVSFSFLGTHPNAPHKKHLNDYLIKNDVIKLKQIRDTYGTKKSTIDVKNLSSSSITSVFSEIKDEKVFPVGIINSDGSFVIPDEEFKRVTTFIFDVALHKPELYEAVNAIFNSISNSIIKAIKLGECADNPEMPIAMVYLNDYGLDDVVEFRMLLNQDKSKKGDIIHEKLMKIYREKTQSRFFVEISQKKEYEQVYKEVKKSQETLDKLIKKDINN